MGKLYAVLKMTDGRVEQVAYNPTPRVEPTKMLQLMASLGYTKDDFDVAQICMGVNEEMIEHQDVIGQNETMAIKMAIAHLKKIPDYYTRLERMEGAAGKKPHDNSKARADERVI